MRFTDNFNFTGREIDTLDQSSLQHMHYRHRYYNPDLGRWYTHDPLGIDPARNLNSLQQFTDKLNTYGYVQGNPINYFDPMGTVKYTAPIMGLFLACHILCRDDYWDDPCDTWWQCMNKCMATVTDPENWHKLR